MMLHNYYGGYGYGASMVLTALLFVAAIVGAIVLYFTFLSSKNESKYHGFLGWMYNFLSFRKLILEPLLKILYLVVAACITVTGIVTLFISPLAGLVTLIVGNLIVRIGYELVLILVLICKNTNDISRKLGNDASGPQFTEEFSVPHKKEAQGNYNYTNQEYGTYGGPGYGQAPRNPDGTVNQAYDNPYYNNTTSSERTGTAQEYQPTPGQNPYMNNNHLQNYETGYGTSQQNQNVTFTDPQNAPKNTAASTSNVLFTAPQDTTYSEPSGSNPEQTSENAPSPNTENGVILEKRDIEERPKTCPSCGTEVPSDAAFCYNCGTQI